MHWKNPRAAENEKLLSSGLDDLCAPEPFLQCRMIQWRREVHYGLIPSGAPHCKGVAHRSTILGIPQPLKSSLARTPTSVVWRSKKISCAESPIPRSTRSEVEAIGSTQWQREAIRRAMAARTLSSSGPDGRNYPTMSRREVEGLIAEGRKIIIVSQHVLKVDAWLPYHPGGEKSIMHMVGRDATDEVNGSVVCSSHSVSPSRVEGQLTHGACRLHSPESVRMMDRYRIGRIEGRWKNFVPPIQGGVFRPRSDETETAVLSISPQESDAAPSSHASSRSPSPLFDRSEMRSRVRAADSLASSSASSVDDTEGGGGGGPAFLDVKTMKEIRLDLDKYPSLDDTTQNGIVQRYRLLHEQIKALGLYQCDYRAYAWEISRFVLLFALTLLFLSWRWYALSGLFMGLFWHQLVFTAHDAGHMGITHHFHVDTVIGIIVADFLGGLSICWWKRNHNIHHIVTNSPEHDPDIEHMPFFAISHRFLKSLRSSYYERIMEYDAAARVLVRIQSWTYYLVLLFGRFNLYRLTWEYLIFDLGPKKGSARWHRWLEFAGQAFFWAWYGYGIVFRAIDSNWGRFVFVMVSHMVTMPLHVQITLSHFAMSTADLGPDESFPQKMLRTTMDVDCPPWLDFVHGGLQFQAIHHLYPRIPRHNLRRTQKLVQDFCSEVGIPYALYGFVDGNKKVIGRLADVSKQAAILAECQRTLERNGDHFHGHHH